MPHHLIQPQAIMHYRFLAAVVIAIALLAGVLAAAAQTDQVGKRRSGTR